MTGDSRYIRALMKQSCHGSRRMTGLQIYQMGYGIDTGHLIVKDGANNPINDGANGS
jgi:hypothetical protein